MTPRSPQKTTIDRSYDAAARRRTTRAGAHRTRCRWTATRSESAFDRRRDECCRHQPCSRDDRARCRAAHRPPPDGAAPRRDAMRRRHTQAAARALRTRPSDMEPKVPSGYSTSVHARCARPTTAWMMQSLGQFVACPVSNRAGVSPTKIRRTPPRDWGAIKSAPQRVRFERKGGWMTVQVPVPPPVFEY